MTGKNTAFFGLLPEDIISRNYGNWFGAQNNEIASGPATAHLGYGNMQRVDLSGAQSNTFLGDVVKPLIGQGNPDTPVGTGTVLMNPAQLQQQQAFQMFSGRDNTPQGTSLNPWVNDGSVAPLFPSDKKTVGVPEVPLVPKTPAIDPIKPTPTAFSMRDNTPQDAVTNTWVNDGSVAAAFPTGGTSWMDSISNTLGGAWDATGGKVFNRDTWGLDSNQFIEVDGKKVANPDYLSAGDIWGGIGTGITTAVNAYGMFNAIDQAEQQIDQGWRQVNMQQEKHDEYMREKAAIKEASKGW